MSRKVPSFDQLITYMDAGASGRDHNLYYNLYSRQPESIHREFMDNSQHLKRRKNGVFMYHEVISITRSQQITVQQQIELLRKLVYQYIQSRAPKNLAYAVLHDEKDDNLHYHLLISSNEAESSTKHRLTKKQFDEVKRNLEIYALECHPELEQKKLISKDRTDSEDDSNADSVSNKGREMERRTGKKVPQRERIKSDLLRIFSAASTHAELIELLESERLALYKRGKYWGVLDESTNRKHRFVTLGVAEEFKVLDAKITPQGQDAKSQQTSEVKETMNEQPSTNPPEQKVDSENKAEVASQTAMDTESSEHVVSQNSEDDSIEDTATMQQTALEEEQAKREEEIKALRQKKTDHQANLKKKR